MPSAPKWLFDAVDLLIPKLPDITITATELLSPSLKRIQFKGDFGKASFPVGAYIDFRVNETDARRYSVAKFDNANDLVDVIVHLHGDGPGSIYMDQLAFGTALNLNKPRSERNYYPKEAKPLVFFGDETSLGVACAFMPLLQKDGRPFAFYFELADENKSIPEQLGLAHYKVFPKNGCFQNPAWLANLPILFDPAWNESHYVLTGNVQSAQAFKKAIKQHTKGSTFVHGYWLAGKKGL